MNLFILLFLFWRSVCIISIKLAPFPVRSISLPFTFIFFIFSSQYSFSLSWSKVQLCKFLLSFFLLQLFSDV